MRVSKRVIQLVARQVGQRQSSYGHGHHQGKSTYNDLPSPAGNWKTNYDAMQRKYNAQLALGIGALLGTILIGKATGMFEFYNDYPLRPATIENYKDE